jgi:hypothetical protein
MNGPHYLCYYKCMKKKSIFEHSEVYQKDAFLLYHKNLTWLQYTKDTKRYKIARNNILKAKRIYEKILKLKPCQRSYTTTINSLTGLAQILGFLGQGKKSINLAKNTYKMYPNALTANRLGAVYLEQDMKKEALFWYKKYEKLALRTDLPKYYIYSDMAAVYKKCANNKLFKKYYSLVRKHISKNTKNKKFWQNFNRMLKPEQVKK